MVTINSRMRLSGEESCYFSASGNVPFQTTVLSELQFLYIMQRLLIKRIPPEEQGRGGMVFRFRMDIDCISLAQVFQKNANAVVGMFDHQVDVDGPLRRAGYVS